MTKRKPTTPVVDTLKVEEPKESTIVVTRDDYIALKTRVDMLEKFVLKGEK